MLVFEIFTIIFGRAARVSAARAREILEMRAERERLSAQGRVATYAVSA